MIRVATVADMPRLLELGRLLLSESSLSRFTFDFAKASDSLANIITGGGVVFVAERDGEIIGGFAGGITELWYSKDKVGFDYSLFVQPGRRNGLTAVKLVTAFETWATELGAVELHLGITTGVNINGTTRLYESLGYQHIGPMFTKKVN